ncbi:hypothetical protein BJ508DRAFT_51106 [Ascobolus immersus RN42]|uniref:Uncharacterized protein n=1 Tax=Ascobolus immersus RN42 TaxID=1160509 RepID=A0A3N4IE17_ASCIM|nr:hypothetical protein BJ508DRAFT_51106 [Ascobolus immersus RN42]
MLFVLLYGELAVLWILFLLRSNCIPPNIPPYPSTPIPISLAYHILPPMACNISGFASTSFPHQNSTRLFCVRFFFSLAPIILMDSFIISA